MIALIGMIVIMTAINQALEDINQECSEGDLPVEGIVMLADEQDEIEIAVRNELGGSMMFSRAAVTNSLMDNPARKCRIEKEAEKAVEYHPNACTRDR